MNNLGDYDPKSGEWEVWGGAEISKTAEEAIEIAKSQGGSVTFRFNKVKLTVKANSDIYRVLKDYYDGMALTRSETEATTARSAMFRQGEGGKFSGGNKIKVKDGEV